MIWILITEGLSMLLGWFHCKNLIKIKIEKRGLGLMAWARWAIFSYIVAAFHVWACILFFGEDESFSFPSILIFQITGMFVAMLDYRTEYGKWPKWPE